MPESSIARQSPASTPSSSAARRYGSGCGLGRETMSPVTTALNGSEATTGSAIGGVGHRDERLRHALGVECLDQLASAGSPVDVLGQRRRELVDEVVDDVLGGHLELELLADVVARGDQRVADEGEPVLLGPDLAVLGGQGVLGAHPERLGVDDGAVEVPQDGGVLSHSYTVEQAHQPIDRAGQGVHARRRSGRDLVRREILVALSSGAPEAQASPPPAGASQHSYRSTPRGLLVSHTPNLRPDATSALTELLQSRIMVLDGAMGTAIQRDRPDEAGYRGERFADWPSDVQGNNDLLTLTQPEIIAGIHREYLEAGADMIETNTFNAKAISLGDYGMEELSYELNFESARLARRECDAMTERTPDKPRYVAGALGPTTRTASISPDVNDPGARNVTYDQLVEAYKTAAKGLLDGGSDVHLHRDDLRHAQRQGGDLRGRDDLRGVRPALARHHLRHDHGRLRAYVVGPGDRGVLALRAPRQPAPGRPQLRARRQGDEALHRRDVAHRRHVRRRATRTLDCPMRSVSTTRSPSETAAIIAEFADSGFVNLVGGCCGTTPAHIAAIAKAVEGKTPRDPVETSTGAAALGSRAGHGRRGHAVRQRRRAHQHHRLGAVPQPHQGRRLHRGPRRRAPAGRGRRPGHRHQHGRGHDRRHRGDGPLHQAGRDRARHLPRADHDRLLQVGRHRGRAQVRPGQVDRQLDLDEGGRGEVRPRGPAVPQVRRRRRRHGLRRGRPGRQPRAPQADLPARVRHPRQRGRLPARGHHLRPQRLRCRDGHRGARQLRRRLHRGDALDQAEPARRAGLRRRLQRLVLVPRQQPRARGDPRGVPLPRDRRRHGHGNRQRRRPRGLRRGARAAARPHRGRHPQPAPGLDRATARDRR